MSYGEPMSSRLLAFDEFLADYESEHGEISDEEMAAATRAAGLRTVVVRPTSSGSDHLGGHLAPIASANDIPAAGSGGGGYW